MDFGANYIIIYNCYNLIDSILKISGFFKPDIEFYGEIAISTASVVITI